MSTLGFGSDNHSGVHPRFLAAISAANHDHAHAYGADSTSRNVLKEFQRTFGADIDVHYVFNGTAANVLSLRALIESHHSVLCSKASHLNVDECGAPEKSIGCKLIGLDHLNGKISAQSIREKLTRLGDQHHSQPKLVSITQPTEFGTVYSIQEIQEIAAVCRENHLYLHMDGARFFSAVESLGCTPKQLTSDIGVDALSLSGTKSGFLYGEAVLLFSRARTHDFKFYRKQLMQLPSKIRFIAAQFGAFLIDDFYLEYARHQRQMAEHLATEINGIVEITRPVQSNVVFAKIPQSWVKPLRKSHFFYVWDENTFECRLMTTFDTTEEQIRSFSMELRRLRELKAAAPSS